MNPTEEQLHELISSMDTYDFVVDDSELTETYGGAARDGKDIRFNNGFAISTESIKNFGSEQVAQLIVSLLYNNNLYCKTIGIDYRLLDDYMISALTILYNDGYINGIRLLPRGTALDKKIYDLFEYSFLDNDFIICADSMNIPKSRFDTRIENNIVSMERLQVFGKQNQYSDNIHINKELTDEELRQVVEMTKKYKCDHIFFNFHNPKYYRSTLEKLQKFGLRKDIRITLLANPLYDDISDFKGLDTITDNPVTIHYNSCKDLNDLYRDHRTSEGQEYYSDLEASGHCTIKEYIDILDKITEIVNHVNSMGYSDLEKVAYLYDYFKKNFIYDPLFKSTPHGLNSYLHNIVGRDRMVCEGFSNMFSCILRRCGIKCFTVGTNNHQFNVLRIKDPKYGIDRIVTLDITNDIDNKEVNNNFDYFLLPPDALLYPQRDSRGYRIYPDATVLNICSSLYIPESEYQKHLKDSNPGYVIDHFGYAIRMLELMGFRLDKQNPSRDEIRSAYLNSGLGRGIPSSILTQAVNAVREREGDNLKASASDFYVQDHINRDKPVIGTNKGHGERPVTLLKADPTIKFAKETEKEISMADHISSTKPVVKDKPIKDAPPKEEVPPKNDEPTQEEKKEEEKKEEKKETLPPKKPEPPKEPVIKPVPEPTVVPPVPSKKIIEKSIANTPELINLLIEIRKFNTSLMNEDNFNKANRIIAKAEGAFRVHSDDFKLDSDDEMSLASIRSMADAYESKSLLTKKIDICEKIINAKAFYEEPFKDCIKEFYNIIAHAAYGVSDIKGTAIEKAIAMKLFTRSDYDRFKRIFAYFKKYGRLSQKEEFAELNISIEDSKIR